MDLKRKNERIKRIQNLWNQVNYLMVELEKLKNEKQKTKNKKV